MTNFDQPPPGLVGGYNGGETSVKVIIGALSAIAIYNGLELTILTLMGFRRRGLYFWSIFLSNELGVIPSGIASLLRFFPIGPLWLSLSMGTFGFWFMVPGQSVVLYSRLHLVLYNRTILRCILYLIVIDTIILAIPTIALTFGSAYVRSNGWDQAYAIMERLQVTWFCAQECLISGLYIWETAKLLNLNPDRSSRRKRILYELLAVNLAMILMDIAIIITEYSNLYYIQVSLKATVYGIKLKLEFAVLNRLALIANAHRGDQASSEPRDLPSSQISAASPTFVFQRVRPKTDSSQLPQTWHDVVDSIG